MNIWRRHEGDKGRRRGRWKESWFEGGDGCLEEQGKGLGGAKREPKLLIP